jgi:hypothetical protein
MSTIQTGRMLKSAFFVAMLSMAPAFVSAANSEADFKGAYAAAEAANREAGRLRNQWTATATNLAEAKKAADNGDFDRATALSREAEALARASIWQSQQEKEAWKALEIR